jgi:D-3-phosphoglycerate dehydrogenase / 2-oxoglutarate reductase
MTPEDSAPLVIVSERLGGVSEEERRIEGAGGRVLGASLWTVDAIREHGGDAAVLLVGAVEPFGREALEALPRCLGVVRRGVGHDNVDLEAATSLGIVVANVPDASVEEVSDHALALLLALERRAVAVHTAVRAGDWTRDPSAVRSARAGVRRFSELTLGVVGFGRIGQALARKGKGIYGRLLACDPVVAPEAAARLGAELVELPELLGAADHVSLHVPMDASNRHLIGSAELASMRRGAILVNTARGGLVDEAAAIEAVRRGWIAAAGLDVTEREPLPPDDPLLGADGILLTAHSAAWSATAEAELSRRSVDAVIDLLNGRRPPSIVNPAVLDAPNLRVPALRP